MTRTRIPTLAPRAKRRNLRWGMIAGSILVLIACVAARYYWGAEPASADPTQRPPARATSTAPSHSTPPANAAAAKPGATSALRIVATVNGVPITGEDLARECLRHYGEEVLERLVNKYLIVGECKRRGVSVTAAEVNGEIRRMATRFGLPVDQWLKMLKQERGISAGQYANDIIWPTLALRKLAGKQLEVTQEELVKEFDTQYGPAVKVRLIVCNDAGTAEKVHAAAAAKPDDFGNLAKQYSVDAPSASAKGMIQPIRKHVGHEEIELVAFQMEEGQVSEVIPVADQFAILKCEGRLPGQQVGLEQVKAGLVEILRDRKMRGVAGQIFRQLQELSKVENVFNDPVKSRQMPGVAAVINGQKVTNRELAELCIERHGEEVLEGTINRRLLELACAKRKITISEADVDEEIRRAASLMLEPKPDGSPDVEKWLTTVTQQQGVSVDVYRSDAVWPSVALKRLAGDKVQITEEELKRGYEANYGPRVRCRAIVLNDLRRAQQVWEKARSTSTPEHFGDLAEQYSIDASGSALHGEVPPIQKYGGQPILEKEAFALQPGELSSIIQVGRDKFVILLCEGRTEPTKVDFATVRDLIREDVHEKKMRIAMAEQFQQLQESATIDNYLTGTTKSPKRSAPLQSATRPPALRTVPATP